MLELAPHSITFLAPPSLEEIPRLDNELRQHFKPKFSVQPSLTRSLVSFQANKTRPVYRWYKYKEAFSAALVEHLFERYGITAGRILDPFAGSGTALFAASAAGIAADGIELLPIGQQIIATKKLVERALTTDDIGDLQRWVTLNPWLSSESRIALPELRITKGAYSSQTQDALERYLGACQGENERVQAVLRFALLCVLESISFTRKDGQYLRWDYRSDRRQGAKPFDKGVILSFEQAITDKIGDILADLQPVSDQPSLFLAESAPAEIRLYSGSCLDVMPILAAHTYDAIITSPPYCNRYDYTRTYALELLCWKRAKRSCRPPSGDAELHGRNRAKDLLKINPAWTQPIAAADAQELLQAILAYLEDRESARLAEQQWHPAHGAWLFL